MTHPTRPMPPSRALALMLLAALGALVLTAAGCPGEQVLPADPSKADAGAAPAASATDAGVPEKKGEGITGKEPPPGSLAVKDVGPPAPTIFFNASLNGYIEPCGCTLDILLGGIDRIAGFVGEARGLAQGHVLVDAGNMLFDAPSLETHRVAQEQAKVDVIIQAQVAMGTATLTPGPNDFALGKLFYLDKVRGAGLEIMVANLKESEGLALGIPHKLVTVGDLKVGLVGLVQPDLFLGIEGLTVSDPIEAARASVEALKKEGAQVLVAVHHGDLKASKALLEAVPQLHFVIVGHAPRESGQADEVDGRFTLEAYDQGRHVGVLKLYGAGQAAPERWANARKASKADLDRIDARIEQVEGQIARVVAANPDQEPPFLATLRQQLEGLQKEKAALASATVELPQDKAAFIYRAEPMMPGYRLETSLTSAREDYNASLKDLIPDEPIIPAPEGAAQYVGAEQCAGCHPQPTEIWKASRHGHAIDTLIKRNKAFDNACIGCHVTGYRLPGGSVLGKLQYTATVGDKAFTKKLENVGCEVCHGPGSLHMLAPLDGAGKAQHIERAVPQTVCVKCHNEEHSTRFDYDTYLPKILGEGHQRKAP